jgi:hypothetical protein
MVDAAGPRGAARPGGGVGGGGGGGSKDSPLIKAVKFLRAVGFMVACLGAAAVAVVLQLGMLPVAVFVDPAWVSLNRCVAVLVRPCVAGCTTTVPCVAVALTRHLALPRCYLVTLGSSCFVWCVCAGLRAASVMMFFARIALRLFAKVRIVGAENLPKSDAPVVFVANHQSMLDPYIMAHLGVPFRCAIKRELLFYPCECRV